MALPYNYSDEYLNYKGLLKKALKYGAKSFFGKRQRPLAAQSMSSVLGIRIY